MREIQVSKKVRKINHGCNKSKKEEDILRYVFEYERLSTRCSYLMNQGDHDQYEELREWVLDAFINC